MVDHVSVGEKGQGLTTIEEQDIFEYTDEGMRHHKGDYKRLVHHIASHLNQHHHGKWTVFAVDTKTTPWELELYPVEDKFIQFSAHGYQFFIYKSSKE